MYTCPFTKEKTAVHKYAKELHQEEIAGICEERDMKFEREDWRAVFAISKAINMKVEEWNERLKKLKRTHIPGPALDDNQRSHRICGKNDRWMGHEMDH
ncbi:hypothetical protein CAEBREN_13218 [Caenorhabditis brenneri]|uniref:Uncharacterized protein n=1 Tax=Caenorhabditis brenneri TaxID=135651 RepID=G0NQF4_CAEBE|nr:hypothetical protein CAEBREN_13218 [Caenorhabditis brenneri]